MSVLHIINGEYYAGAERVQDTLADGLSKNGIFVIYASLKTGVFDEMRSFKGAELRNFPPRGATSFFRAAFIAVWAFKKNVKIVHSHTPRTGIVAALVSRFLNIPHVHHVHSPTLYDTENRLRNWVKTSMERIALYNSSVVLAVSADVLNYLLTQGIRRNKIELIYNGVPDHFQQKKRRDPGEVLGMAALFRPRKGLEELLTAFSLAHKTRPNMKLRLIGGFESAAYEGKVKETALRLGLNESVEWIGFIKDVSKELEKLDVFIIPSLFGEGLPMVLLEAMSARLPILASPVGGIPEAIEDRMSGIFIKPKDVKSFSATIIEIVASIQLRNHLRTNAREAYLRRFSDEKMADAVADCYRSLLEKR